MTLVEPQPPALPERYLPTGRCNPDAVFRPLPKIETAGQLRRELAKYRRRYAKFQCNLTPSLEPTRLTLPLDHFDWRLQTEADLMDGLGPITGTGPWQSVRIPHYGGPLGRATAYYRTTFQITDDMLAKGALFICFWGVDYQAHVIINGTYLGSHEGFFAPFEFDFTSVAHLGENTLLVHVENDAICMANSSWGEDGYLYEGDKLYAATGPGWDDPQLGWHHCPPGMGIYQPVSIEARAPVHIHDLFIRPILEEQRAEAWVEVYNCHRLRKPATLELSVFGQNFRGTVSRDLKYKPDGPLGPGINYFRVPFEVAEPRVWDTENPWLYQARVSVHDENNLLLDKRACQFGMRSFSMDETSEPKGRFYLNGQEVRLRGANTMGFEQQDVIKKDLEQLRDDILLAKICHLNYWRLTQRPVQAEVYEMCDQLGLMTQTDLPLFAVLRRNQFSEAVRQAEEMERLVRCHPCNILISYINEPLPAKERPFASGVQVSRHLARPELESFFTATDQAVRLANPDRVIKPVDGDYDPPAPGLPDNHCYCGWYNGHGVDLGKLHKGYWQPVKPGWFYACGEFGSEGLDPVDIMRSRYPPEWLPQTVEEEKVWNPRQILNAQTGNFHFMWFDTQHTLKGWVDASQRHQAWITRLMAEAYRRDCRLNSCAIHLFIDAFPAGWMKAIMDVERQPKPAYFVYREALTPLMVNLRTDRYAFFSGETARLEAWVCNDRLFAPDPTYLHYQVELGGHVLMAERVRAHVPVCDVAFQGFLPLPMPTTDIRIPITVRLGLLDPEGQVLHDCAVTLEVFPEPVSIPPIASQRRLYITGNLEGKAARLARELNLSPTQFEDITDSETTTILIDDFTQYEKQEAAILDAARQGATVVFLELREGKFQVAESTVKVIPCGMNPVHFVSRATDHPLVTDFNADDFKFWYDADRGYVTPLLATTFTAEGWRPILTSGNGSWGSDWQPALAAAEISYGAGRFRICQMTLAGRMQISPVARLFARRLLGFG